ncbi:MAG: HlyC/CorC family transporter [Blautia sp.]|nr:HlyC/CorC family transporter [Blautia sp.]
MDFHTVAAQLLAILILIALSAFFSSAETAMTSVNQIRIQTLAEEGNKRAVRLLRILQNSQKMLSTILIGNNIVNMAVSALTTSLTIAVVGNAYVGIATGLLTLIILLFGEITPKTLATIEAEKIALAYAGIIGILMTLMIPVVWVVEKLGQQVMRLFRVDASSRPVVVTPNEIRTMVRVGEQGGSIENEEKEMIDNVFDFGDFMAKDVMIPRIDMTIVDVKTTYEELMAIFREDMHTRFPVYDTDTDNVIGIINIKDVLLLTESQKKDFSIRNILREAFFTYEQKPTRDLMVEMRRRRVSIAIVVDEYGATAGLVTLEDLLEEIVGEIRDEYDEDEEEDVTVLRQGVEYSSLGSTKLSEINDALGLSLESEDNDSLGGYFMEKLDRMPKVGDHLELEGGVRLVVEEMDRNRIEKIHISLPEKEPQEKEKQSLPS